MIVELTWGEMMLAHVIAGQRISWNIKKAREGRAGVDEGRDSDGLHVTGCRGEMAVAKALGRYWSGAINDLGAADVGMAVQVRSVNGPNKRLILHTWDKDDQPFVLADCSLAPRIDLVGWILGANGKLQEYWSDPSGKGRPAFFVPTPKLASFETLQVPR